MAGLLDLFGQRDPNDPVNMGLLGMSAALGTPVRQGGGVGPAFGAFGQGFQNSQQAEVRRRLMESQIEENKRTKEMNDYMVVGKNLFNRKTGQFVPLPEGMTSDELPKDVQSFNEFMRRTPEERQAWLDFKRNNYSVDTVAGVPNVVYKGAPSSSATPQARPLSALDIELDAARRKKQAEAGGTETGKVAGVAEAGLAGSDIDVSMVENVVNQLKKHPGKKYAVGTPLLSQLPDNITIGGTDHADFLAKFKQAQGKVFLKGYETLKGGGQITEIEGNKAQQAIAAMDRSQSKEEFDKSLDDYLDAYKKGIEKLKKQRALGQTTSAKDIESRMTPDDIRKVGQEMAGLPPSRDEVNARRKKYGLPPL